MTISNQQIILIKQMCPELYKLWKKFNFMMTKVGLKYKLTSVARDYKEQIALYAQGRESLANVNKYRKIAGLSPIKEKENIIVTWTLKSHHIINLDDQDESNDKSRAFDIVLLDNNKVTWDLKVNVNKNQIPDYEEAAQIGKSVGLVPGAYFKNPDYPHYQI